MTSPKEKALELCESFMLCNSYQAIVWYNAKQCALIAVDEVIKVFYFINPNCEDLILLGELKFWKQVKREIQKL